MGYATTIQRLRDADRETEISCEALDGSDEDGAVLELTVVLGYGSSAASRHEGYVRLGRRHFDSLAEWVGHHAEALRTAQWAEENAPKGEHDDLPAYEMELDRLRQAVRGVIADAQEHVDDGEDCGRLGSGRRGACRLCRAAEDLRGIVGSDGPEDAG